MPPFATSLLSKQACKHLGKSNRAATKLRSQFLLLNLQDNGPWFVPLVPQYHTSTYVVQTRQYILQWTSFFFLQIVKLKKVVFPIIVTQNFSLKLFFIFSHVTILFITSRAFCLLMFSDNKEAYFLSFKVACFTFCCL